MISWICSNFKTCVHHVAKFVSAISWTIGQAPPQMIPEFGLTIRIFPLGYRVSNLVTWKSCHAFWNCAQWVNMHPRLTLFWNVKSNTYETNGKKPSFLIYIYITQYIYIYNQHCSDIVILIIILSSSFEVSCLGSPGLLVIWGLPC